MTLNKLFFLSEPPTAPQKESTTKANWLFQQLVVQASVEHLNDNAESLIGFNKLLSKPPQTIIKQVGYEFGESFITAINFYYG